MADPALPKMVSTFFSGDVEIEVPMLGRPRSPRRVAYDGDDLKSWNKTFDFLADPAFQKAYRRGMDSGHHIARPAGSDLDLKLEFRVHIAIAAAKMASRLEGDFVECGVNTGIYSLAICEYLAFNNIQKNFYLFDTFAGVPEDLALPTELERVRQHQSFYSDCYETAKANFAPYPKARLVRGKVPETLPTADITRVCYLSIDMNLAQPERAAMEYFWDRLSVGAPVVLDDYAWAGYEAQQREMDDFAASKGTMVMTLPTGQGLLIKT